MDYKQDNGEASGSSDLHAATSADSVTGREASESYFSEAEESCASEENDSERRSRTVTLLEAKRTVELAQRLKLVSLNVAIESAKRRSADADNRKLKSDLATLTNRAIKASKDIESLLAALGGKNSGPAGSDGDYRSALRLKKDLEVILEQSESALEALDRIHLSR